MKTSLIIIFALLMACETTTNNLYPQRNALPVEISEDVTGEGWLYLGHFVSDNGGIAIFAEQDGECACLVYIPYAGSVFSVTCAECMALYNEVCVRDQMCNDDPYRTDSLEEDNI